MKTIIALSLVLGMLASAAAVEASDSSDAGPVLGNWEGESTCTIPDSPCHNEHVVYEIKAEKAPALAVDAYKIVGGEKQFMGTLACRYLASEQTLRCVGRRPDDIWTIMINGDSMTGTLTVGPDKKLYRKVKVDRVAKH